MFIPLNNGYINADAIKIIRSDLDHKSVIETKDGEIYHTYLHEDQIETLTGTIIPAKEGYTHIEPHLQPDGVIYFHTTPIVAWRINGYGIAEPIIPDDICYDSFNAIMYPDGRVRIPASNYFDTFEDYKNTVIMEKKLLKK